MARALLTFIALSLCGCYGGVYLPPSVNVPALQKAGQVAVSASIRPSMPAGSLNGSAAVAVSDVLRLAGSAVVADDVQRSGRAGDVLMGAELPLFVPRVLALGVLGGAGYGRVAARHEHCRRFDEGYCAVPPGYVDSARARYVRYVLQSHLAVRAPKWVHGAVGLRLSVLATHVDRVDDEPVDIHARPVALEPFGVVRVGLPWLHFEAQLRYGGVVNQPRFDGRSLVVPDQLTISLGARIVLGPGIEPTWSKPTRAAQPQAQPPRSIQDG